MLLDLLLPASCASCETDVSRPGQLCAACFSALTFITPPLCRACGAPFATTTDLCHACAAAPPPWTLARAALLYDDAARKLILPFKNAGREEIADTLAFHMQRAGAGLLAQAELLVPVPLHRARLLRRRYNQAALLARALARLAGIPCLPDALLRTRATPRLGPLSASERARVLAGSIGVRPARRAAVEGRHIVLIDDVLTSGATAGVCARALLDAGATNVDVLVACRVADPRAHADIPAETKDTEFEDD